MALNGFMNLSQRRTIVLFAYSEKDGELICNFISRLYLSVRISNNKMASQKRFLIF